jgi:ABC-2 type transport system ATP-binding protein
MSAAIETAGVGKQYGSHWALRDCYLNIPEACVVALVGPNGAGKATLLFLIVGLSEPTCGSVTVAGGLAAGSQAALSQVAYLAQDHALYRRFSAGDHLHLGRSLNAGFDYSFARLRLDELGIPIGKAAGKLSGASKPRWR